MNRKPNRRCDYCGTPYYAWPRKVERGLDLCCSKSCREFLKRKSWQRTCEWCEKVFYPKPSAVKKGKGRFCSIDCSAAHRKSPEYTNPELMLKAKAILKYAIKIGVIKKEPCKVCGAIEGIMGHHQDYTKPLEVIWFCSKHHISWHNFLSGLERRKN